MKICSLAAPAGAIALVAAAATLAPHMASAQTAGELAEPLVLDVVALVPPRVLESRERRIPIQEVSPRDPARPPEAVIERKLVFEADTGFRVAGSGLRVRRIQGLTKMSSRVSKDKRAVTVLFSLRNGAPNAEAPSVFDVTLNLRQERKGHGQKIVLARGLTLERHGNYPMWPDTEAPSLEGAEIYLFAPDGAIIANAPIGQPIPLPERGAEIMVERGRRAPVLRLRAVGR